MTDTSGHSPLDTPLDPGAGTGAARRDPVTGLLLADAPASTGEHGATAAGSTGSSSGTAGATAGAAKEQAAHLGGEAVQSGQHVAGAAKEQAATVASEAGRQAKDLLAQTRGELGGQAAAQKERAATGLHSLGADLSAISRGEAPASGLATEFAQQASDRVTTVARWLEDREPAELLHDVQNFARRRPGAFLAIAAGVGLVAGRLTRGVAAATREEHAADAAPATSSAPLAAPVPTTAPTAGPTAGAAAGFPGTPRVDELGAPVVDDPWTPADATRTASGTTPGLR